MGGPPKTYLFYHETRYIYHLKTEGDDYPFKHQVRRNNGSVVKKQAERDFMKKQIRLKESQNEEPPGQTSSAEEECNSAVICRMWRISETGRKRYMLCYNDRLSILHNQATFHCYRITGFARTACIISDATP